MTEEQAKKLREPFPPAMIGKLPKLSCKRCSESPGKVCSEHTKQRCGVCGNYISTAHIDLDYVGHAATSDRLLQVDPEWTWEPMAVGPNGEPLITNGGMWIKLTVAGVTRPGFGDGNTPKEIIGDAIRNAAMRFGVALDLWAKEDLHADENGVRQVDGATGRANTDETRSPAGAATQPPAPSQFNPPSAVQEQLAAKQGSSVPNQDGGVPEEVVITFGKWNGKRLGELVDSQSGYLKWLASDKFEPKTKEQRRVKAAAQTLLGMELTFHGEPEPAAAGGSYSDDIPFAAVIW